MEKFVVTGGKPLAGEITISGAKNAAVAIIPAAILAKGRSVIENVPDISDVEILLEILEHMGAKTERLSSDTIAIDTTELDSNEVPYEFARAMRASYYFLGALLGRCSEAIVSMPGGCNFGVRPIDQHLKGFSALGAEVSSDGGMIHASAHRLTGCHIHFDVVSVGATINVMMAAVKARGITILENVAKEPHIVDLANFLNTMGADVNGAGTSEIVINGVRQEDLHPIEYTTIPDRIEAGTFMTAIIATRGKAIIKDVYPAHLTFFTDKLLKMGANIKLIEPNSLEVSCKNRLNSINFITQPYPGFPTDLQSMAMTLLSTANGVGIITESLYENRFMQVPELRRMGADIHQDRNHAIIKGVKKLSGATLAASDLRAGASLVVAALMAEGNSVIEKLHHIDRGYENFESKIRLLGGKIERRKEVLPETLTEDIRNESYL